MKNNLIKYLLVLSVLLNISFLGAAAYTRYRLPFMPGSSPDCGPHGGYLFERLTLSPEQTKTLHQKALSFRGTLDQKRQEVFKMRAALFSLLRADQPDNQGIEESISRINNQQREIQKMVISHILEFKSMLGKDQQQKFLDLIEMAMAGGKGNLYPVCP
jgi:Spy/CpxP family protein refolding chaperone